MLSHAASSLGGKRDILQGPAVVGSRLRARPIAGKPRARSLLVLTTPAFMRIFPRPVGKSASCMPLPLWFYSRWCYQ